MGTAGVAISEDEIGACVCDPGFAGKRLRRRVPRLRRGARDVRVDERARVWLGQTPPATETGDGSDGADYADQSWTCVCSDDYMGELCDIPCPCARFGLAAGVCEIDEAKRASGAFANEELGKCACEPTHTGEDCSVPCPPCVRGPRRLRTPGRVRGRHQRRRRRDLRGHHAVAVGEGGGGGGGARGREVLLPRGSQRGGGLGGTTGRTARCRAVRACTARAASAARACATPGSRARRATSSAAGAACSRSLRSTPTPSGTGASTSTAFPVCPGTTPPPTRVCSTRARCTA